METTLGIDLASRAEKTALCVIAWNGQSAELRVLARSRWGGDQLDDQLLASAIAGGRRVDGTGGWGTPGRPAKVAIDAPFGWPDRFVDAVEGHRLLRSWPSGLDEPRATFERRETDRFVTRTAKKIPLSVSTDRIAYPAMRCAVLLSEVARRLPDALLARDGSGLIAEAYPDATLRMWLPDVAGATPSVSYKGANVGAKAQRERIMLALLDGLGPAFAIAARDRESCVAFDDCLDALVCALLARAVEQGHTMRPDTDEQQALARTEGWIHLPNPGTLTELI
jgi:hypothetical protein